MELQFDSMRGPKGSAGNYSLGLYAVAGVLLAGGVLSLLVRHDPALDRQVAAAGAEEHGIAVKGALGN